MYRSWRMEYDGGLSADERDLIESRRDLLRNAFLSRPVLWRAAGDAAGRRLLALDLHRPAECLGRFRAEELREVRDEAEFILQVITGTDSSVGPD